MLNGSNRPVKLGFGWSLGIRHPRPINKQTGERRFVSSDLLIRDISLSKVNS